jgi:hypothetical protein
MAFGLEQTGENMTGNCSLVRSLYDAFGCDPTAISHRLDPSVAWISCTTAKAISWGGRHSGVAGAVSFFKALTETLDFEVFQQRQFFAAAADNMIVFGRTQARQDHWQEIRQRTGTCLYMPSQIRGENMPWNTILKLQRQLRTLSSFRD